MSPVTAGMEGAVGGGPAARLCFAIAGRAMALPLERVLEVLPAPAHIAALPLAPPGIRGLAQIRGQVVAILHPGRLLDLPEATAGTHLLLLRHAGLLLGLPVEALLGIRRGGTVDEVPPLALDTLLEQALAINMMPGREMRTGAGRDGGGLPSSPAQTQRTLVSFHVAGQEYALPVGLLRQVASLPAQVAPLPHAPAAMLGMGQVGDRLLPLLDLRALLGLPASGQGQGKVLHVTHGGHAFGLLVDRLGDLLRVADDALEPVPALFDEIGREVEAVCRLEGGRRLVSLLSPAHLLARDGIGAILPDGPASPGPLAAPAAIGEQAALLRIRVAGEDYALPLGHVGAVSRPGRLTPVPQAPPILAGIGQADGAPLPVIDLRRRLALPADAHAARHLVMLRSGGGRFGLLVDLAAGLVRVPLAAIAPAPALSAAQARLIARVATDGERMLPILEPALLADLAADAALGKLTADAALGEGAA